MRHTQPTWYILLMVVGILCLPGISSAAQTELRTTAGVREEYNDNIFFRADNEESDFITTGILGLDLKAATERLTSAWGAEWQGFYYLDNHDLSDVDHQYDGAVSYLLTPKFSFNVEADYEIDNRPDLNVDETGLSQASERRDSQRYTSGFQYQITERTQLFTSGQYGRDDYENDEQDDDFKTWGGVAGISHRFAAFIKPTIGRLVGGYARYEFPDNQTDYYYMNIGVTRSLTETLELSVDAGPRYAESEFDVRQLVLNPNLPATQTETEDTWGGSARIYLKYRTDVTRWEFTAAHDLTGTGGRGQSLERTEANFDINHRWHWAMSTGLTLRYFLNRSDVDDPDLEEVDVSTFRARPRLRYHFTDDLYLEAAYTYTHREDNDDDTTIERNQVFFELRYAPVIWE